MFRNIHSKRPVLKSLFNKVLGLQPAALSISCASGRARNLKTVPMAISIDISKTYYQNWFVICFLRSAYGRFMELLIETYNKSFSCS